MNKLRIGYLSTMYHTSHILKGRRWIEESLGIATEWRLFGTGPAMVDAFSADLLDIGYIGLPPAMIGIGKGLKLKCVAGGHVEGTAMIGIQGTTACHSDDEVSRVLNQFKGRKIGSPSQGSIHDVIIRFLLHKHGLSQVEIINYPWADLIPEAIQAEEIDGAVGTPPLAILARRYYGCDIIIPPACLWPFNPSYGIVVTETMLRKAEMLEQFLTLHERACNLIVQKPQHAAQVVAHEVQVVDSLFVLEVFAVSPRYCSSLPQEYLDATLEFVPVLQKMGYLARNVTRDDIFDLSLIEKIHPEQHHYLVPLQAR